MPLTDPVPAAALIVCEQRGEAHYEAKFRCGGRQVKRRIGRAWLTRDDAAAGGHAAAVWPTGPSMPAPLARRPKRPWARTPGVLGPWRGLRLPGYSSHEGGAAACPNPQVA